MNGHSKELIKLTTKLLTEHMLKRSKNGGSLRQTCH